MEPAALILFYLNSKLLRNMGANGTNHFYCAWICRACDRATGSHRDTAPDRKSHKCMVDRTSLRSWLHCPFSVLPFPLVSIVRCKKSILNTVTPPGTWIIQHSTYADFPSTFMQCARISSLDLPSMSMISSLPFSIRQKYRFSGKMIDGDEWRGIVVVMRNDLP